MWSTNISILIRYQMINYIFSLFFNVCLRNIRISGYSNMIFMPPSVTSTTSHYITLFRVVNFPRFECVSRLYTMSGTKVQVHSRIVWKFKTILIIGSALFDSLQLFQLLGRIKGSVVFVFAYKNILQTLAYNHDISNNVSDNFLYSEIQCIISINGKIIIFVFHLLIANEYRIRRIASEQV